ncbi:hypothetical protein AUV07_08385 [Microbacterium sp. CH1]|nr:hypothetical protein AUV07_08385 [Microbacterium sp. CH1]
MKVALPGEPVQIFRGEQLVATGIRSKHTAERLQGEVLLTPCVWRNYVAMRGNHDDRHRLPGSVS